MRGAFHTLTDQRQRHHMLTAVPLLPCAHPACRTTANMQPALASMLAPALLSARALLAPGALVSRTFATKTPAHGAGLKEHEREAATKGAAERYARISQIFDLTGSTALVTGGSRGIGAAIALGLARSGANIIVAGGSMWAVLLSGSNCGAGSALHLYCLAVSSCSATQLRGRSL